MLQTSLPGLDGASDVFDKSLVRMPNVSVQFPMPCLKNRIIHSNINITDPASSNKKER